MRNRNRMLGFTLVEILVALFVFSLLAVIMANGLHRLIRVQSHVDQQADHVRELQMAVVHLARDIELAMYRPITLAHGEEALAFVGRKNEFEFTCEGAADAGMLQSHLQRVEYHYEDHALKRAVSPMLDQADGITATKRVILTGVNEARFEYLDKRGKYHQGWPLQADTTQPLPKAVRLTLQLANEGSFIQTFVLAAENTGTEVIRAQ